MQVPRPRTVARFPVIVGPTAGGKSALAVEVARVVGGEIVSADSVQIFRGMNIGSAKPTAEERGGVPHHLIDVVDPTDVFTVADWLARAERAIEEIRSRGRVPVVVGGTHLYIKNFLEGMFEGPGANEELRERLRAVPSSELRAELERVDPAAAARIHPNDLRRTIRALEVYRLTGAAISQHQSQWDAQGRGRTDCVLVGLEWAVEAINPRINARVKQMMERGLLDEVRGLWSRGAFGPGTAGTPNQAREALGYKQLMAHLEGRSTLEEAVEAIKIETRRFAKNQRTWLKRLRPTAGSAWIDAGTVPSAEWASRVVEACSRPA